MALKGYDMAALIAKPNEYADSLSIDKLVKLLKKLADAYYNTNQSIVSDEIYDTLIDNLVERDPNHTYLKQIGAPITGDGNKVTLPFPMGSLTKVKPNSGTLDKWLVKYTGPYIISDKLDGVSAQLYKDQLGNVFLYSRGEGDVGRDISHLIKGVRGINNVDLKKIPNGTSIRGELIINKSNFMKIASRMKNARNAVSGLVVSKNIDKELLNLAQYVTYSILSPRMVQSEQMEKLKKWGFDVVDYISTLTMTENSLQLIMKERKLKSPYEIDGIVCVDDSAIHPHQGGYPLHAFAFKMILDNQIATTTVINVIWNVSMDGYLKPKIQIDKVDILGSTIEFATAYNAKYIYDNKIGSGSIIKIIKSNDILPVIYEVVKPSASAQMPDIDYFWNNTGVDIIASNISSKTSDVIAVKLLSHFFKTLKIKYIGEGIITKLVDNGYDTVYKILTANYTKLTTIEGIGEKMLDKIFDEIFNTFDTMELHTFMAASHKFGRGLGERKLFEVTQQYPMLLKNKWTKDEMYDNIIGLPGFGEESTQLFVDNYKKFYDFYKELCKIKNLNIKRFEDDSNVASVANVATSSSSSSSPQSSLLFSGAVVVFTGFRDQSLNQFIIKNGGRVNDSVSSKTTLVIYDDKGGVHGKLATAIEKGIPTITRLDFMKKYNLS